MQCLDALSGADWRSLETRRPALVARPVADDDPAAGGYGVFAAAAVEPYALLTLYECGMRAMRTRMPSF